MSNIAALWFVGGFFENYVGRIKLVIIFVIGLIIPGCLLALIYPDGLHYGASPAIFAFIGVLVNWALREKGLWKTYREQIGVGYVVGFFFLSNVIGVTTLIFHLLFFYRHALGFHNQKYKNTARFYLTDYYIPQNQGLRRRRNNEV